MSNFQMYGKCHDLHKLSSGVHGWTLLGVGGGVGKFGSLEGKHLISVRNVIICIDKLQV